MEALMLHTDIPVSDVKSVSVFYNKTFADSLYGIECFIAGTNFEKPYNYCLERNVTNNEDFIERLIEKMAEGNVLPVHISEIIQDCFPCSYTNVQ